MFFYLHKDICSQVIRIREPHSAAINGDCAKVEAATEAVVRLLTCKDQNGLTLLQRTGARDDLRDKHGREPPHYLVHRGSLRYTTVDQQSDSYEDLEDEADGEPAPNTA